VKRKDHENPLSVEEVHRKNKKQRVVAPAVVDDSWPHGYCNKGAHDPDSNISIKQLKAVPISRGCRTSIEVSQDKFQTTTDSPSDNSTIIDNSKGQIAPLSSHQAGTISINMFSGSDGRRRSKKLSGQKINDEKKTCRIGDAHQISMDSIPPCRLNLENNRIGDALVAYDQLWDQARGAKAFQDNKEIEVYANSLQTFQKELFYATLHQSNYDFLLAKQLMDGKTMQIQIPISTSTLEMGTA
jgi:hypothetical protein